MSISRRELLQRGGLVGAALLTGILPTPAARPLRPHGEHRFVELPGLLNPNLLAQFVDPLPIPPIARRHSLRKAPGAPETELPYYRMHLRQVEAKLHRDLPPTRLWGIGSGSPGPTFETRSGQGLLVEWVSDLPNRHFLPIDHTLHGAESGVPEVRSVIHLHGAKAPPESDGYPDNWYVPGRSALCHYPNHQDSALLWYHDHAMGINRLNIYAGLFGLFIIRDSVEDALNLPRGPHEIPLVICDRILDLAAQLYYPVSGEPGKPWIPEFAGNLMLVNGKIFPYLEVEPRKYRLRILNATNGRFLHLSFGSPRSRYEPVYQIGGDQGLLPKPVATDRFVPMAAAERSDLIVDFTSHQGESIILNNDLLPMMQFRVADSRVHDTSIFPAVLRPMTQVSPAQATKTRLLSLGDNPMMGVNSIMLLNGSRWSDPITERPLVDTVEIWNLINLTEDAHPIHLHLVRFQVLDRRYFDVAAYIKRRELTWMGAPVAPLPYEAGWKDTVLANPQMVTRIIIRFEGFTGRYVWHCHILEHEDNEMMRPFEVITPQEAALGLSPELETQWPDGTPRDWCTGGTIVRR